MLEVACIRIECVRGMCVWHTIRRTLLLGFLGCLFHLSDFLLDTLTPGYWFETKQAITGVESDDTMDGTSFHIGENDNADVVVWQKCSQGAKTIHATAMLDHRVSSIRSDHPAQAVAHIGEFGVFLGLKDNHPWHMYLGELSF